MTVDVTPRYDPDDDQDDTPNVTQLPAASLSPLASLRESYAKVLDENYIDLKIPRWDERTPYAIYVRYRPVDPTAAQKAIKRRQKARTDDANILATLDALVGACIGVFAVVDTTIDEPVRLSLRQDEPEGEWTRFDPDLATAFGWSETRAVDVARKLYLSDAAVLGAFAALSEWSGIGMSAADDDFLGN